MIDILFLLLWWAVWLVMPMFSLPYKHLWSAIIIISLAGTGSLTAYYYYRTMYPWGTIREDVLLRVGPHETYGTCGMLKANDRVVLCNAHETWSHVQKEGGRGWIPQEFVTIDAP